MNTGAQFDLHPDAESLSAFAEYALGAREHEEIMAHLAVCGRCREVVFLAQESTGLEVAEDREQELVPIAAMQAAAVASVPDQIVPLRRRWYRNWWMIGVPVGALAAIAALATVIYVRHVEQRSEMAKNVTVMTPAVPATNVATEEPATKQMPGEVSRERQAEAKAKTAFRASGIVAPPPPAAQPEANKPMAGGSGGGLQAAEGLMASSRAEGRAEAKKEAPELDSKNEQERPAMAAPVHPPEAAAAQAPLRSATESVTVSQADQLMAASAQAVPESESLKARHVGGAAGTFSMYKAMPPLLPSGLPAVSTATAERSVLGIDKTGNVFLSDDAGVHWEVVARQWNGRAVAVRTQEIRKKDEAGGAGTTTAKFELANDEGKIWVSGDGKTWKVK